MLAIEDAGVKPKGLFDFTLEQGFLVESDCDVLVGLRDGLSP
jgi:hypothetical protein